MKSTPSSLPKRYHPILVAIHWTTALLVIFMLVIGKVSLKWMPNDAAKIFPLAAHMITGISILVLTLVRIFIRLRFPKPAPATAGNRFLDAIGVITHYLLYLGALGMGISGLGIASQAGLLSSVFGGSGALPEDFFVYPVRYGHGYLSSALILIILLHTGAAIFHQFIRKDKLLSRMWFGNRKSTT
jgi:cytochrome b561